MGVWADGLRARNRDPGGGCGVGVGSLDRVDFGRWRREVACRPRTGFVGAGNYGAGTCKQGACDGVGFVVFGGRRRREFFVCVCGHGAGRAGHEVWSFVEDVLEFFVREEAADYVFDVEGQGFVLVFERLDFDL